MEIGFEKWCGMDDEVDGLGIKKGDISIYGKGRMMA
jgi:hypothetical protein